MLIGIVSLNTKFPAVNERISFSPENVEDQKVDARENYQNSMGKLNWGVGLTIVGILILIILGTMLLKGKIEY
jgi:hypothetical protein